MAETTGIAWCDKAGIDLNATGRVLGGYKNAARRTGLSIKQWIERRQNGLRWCFRCRTWGPVEQFCIDKSRLGGRASSCKPCMSDASTASRYGISLGELRTFRLQHGNRCGICARSSPPLYIDHNHKTGALRGLLCPGCNTAIGQFDESPALFAAALRYLSNG